MPYDESLAERVRRQFANRKVAVEPMRMMGGIVFMVDDKMCVGVSRDRLMVRTGPELQPAALQRPGCAPMEFGGKTMKGFVFVDAEYLWTEKQLGYWIDLGLKFNPLATAAKRSARKRK